MTWDERLARQYAVWRALDSARVCQNAAPSHSDTQQEWALIRNACLRESNRLARIAARQRREHGLLREART